MELSPSSECWSFVSTRTCLAVVSPPRGRGEEPPRAAPGLPLLGFFPPSNATTPGAPSRHDRSLGRGGRESPNSRRCRPQGSCPSRRFWLRSRRARTLARSTASRDAPTLRGLVPCRSRPWETPSRAFPSRGAVPDLSGLVLPCRFVSTTADATHSGASRPLSPWRRPVAHPSDLRPGERLRSRDRGSLRPLRPDQRRAEARRPSDRTTLARRDSPVDAAVTPASKLCSPRESVRFRPQPWPG